MTDKDSLTDTTMVLTLLFLDNLKEMKESGLCPCSYKPQLVL